MKVNKKILDKLRDNYGSRNSANVQIGIDNTDHMVLVCNECKSIMEILEVMNEKCVGYKGKRDRCTWIRGLCHKCNAFGLRKIYWKTEDGVGYFNRTYNIKQETGELNG